MQILLNHLLDTWYILSRTMIKVTTWNVIFAPRYTRHNLHYLDRRIHRACIPLRSTVLSYKLFIISNPTQRCAVTLHILCRDVPMAVGGMSMLSTSNYIARRFGVRAAMPGFIALKLCPQLLIVPTNFDKYRVRICQKSCIAYLEACFI